MSDLEVKMMLGYLKEYGGSSSWSMDTPLEIKIRALEQYIAEHPGDHDALDHLANHYGNNKQYSECLEAFTRLCRLYPGNEMYRNRLARTYYHLGLYDECLALCREEFYSNTLELANMYFMRANAYEKLGDLNKAIKYSRMSVRLDPDHPYANGARGYFLHMKKCYKAAIRSYDSALKAHPFLHTPNFNKACIYSLTGRLWLSLRNLHMSFDRSAEYYELAFTEEELANVRQTNGFKHLMKKFEELAEQNNNKKT
jgi:tetratricopeptide (TPR) repeat protein